MKTNFFMELKVTDFICFINGTTTGSVIKWEVRGLMVSALVYGVSGMGSSPKTLYSHGASLHPGVDMGTSKFNAGGNPAMD